MNGYPMPGGNRVAGAWERLSQRRPTPAAPSRHAGVVAGGGIAEFTPEWDALSTDEKLKRYTASGQDALTTSVNASVRGLLPEFDQRLQGVREGIQRRGVGGGDTASGYETQVTDDFTRNVSDAVARGSMDLYQTGLDRLYGYRDARTAQSNAKGAARNALWGGLGSLAGSYLGSK